MKKTMIYFGCIMSMIGSMNVFAFNQKQLETNKQTVINFYNQVVNEKNFENAEKYLGSKYIQHNPIAADGAEGLKGYIQWLQQNFPTAHAEIKKVFADNNYVILHVHFVLEPETRGAAIMDILRLENGKIVEHWDVIQDIPEKPANPNGMF
jgi:predicted SnoaL-like aldol condensation-catalyzing enzyme